MSRATTSAAGISPHRLADVTVRLAEKLRDTSNPDAVARWLCGEIPDPLDRWALTFFLARLAADPGESSASLLRRLWRPGRGKRAA